MIKGFYEYITEKYQEDIRHNYEIYGVEDFYRKVGSEYKNPHLNDIQSSMDYIHTNYPEILTNVLDLACGTGEITNILSEYGVKDIIGCDPYLYKEYKQQTGKQCLDFSFEDIQRGALDDKKFNTIICSYAMHLADTSIVPEMLWRLSMISENLIIISPNNKPIIGEDNGWELLEKFRNGKCKNAIYITKN